MICFQFWVSLTSLSLESIFINGSSTLWFAFNFEYLWHRYHLSFSYDDAKTRCDLLSILSIFDIAITPLNCAAMEKVSCDLLSILSIFDIAITTWLWWRYRPTVVICFQFWVSLTSLSLWAIPTLYFSTLWFAFNFEYLWHRYHSRPLTTAWRICCDLLSILSIFDIAITFSTRITDYKPSCDLLSILSIFDIAITILWMYGSCTGLWFAFNFEYLWHRYH